MKTNNYINYLLFLVIIFTLNGCVSAQQFSKYNKIDNISRENSYCNQRFSKDGKYLNGQYKISLSKNSAIYALYKNGYYQEVFNEFKGFIWSKEKYDENNNLIEYIAYSNPKKNIEDEYYKIQKYDSIQTFIKENNPINSTIFYNGKNFNIKYTIESQKMKIVSEINNFKIINSLNLFLGIPGKLFFSNCHNNKYIFGNSHDIGWRNKKLYVETQNPNGNIYQTFALEDPNKEENEINFIDYEEVNN